VLSIIDSVMKQHHAGFRGWSSPVHFFWGTFDLAVTRYSGRAETTDPSAGVIARYGGGEELICAGWWPGNEHVRSPAFFAYAHPAPQGISELSIGPAEAAWNANAGEFLLPYEAVRAEAEPQRAVLEFLRTTYAGAAGLLGWSEALTQVNAPPPAG
jgi:hypothetical protein